MLKRIRAGESGATLIELLVVILLTAVVGSVVTGGVLSAHRATRTSEARIQALTDTQVAVERVSRELRASDARKVTIPASALVEAGPNRVVADALRGSQRHRFVYFVQPQPDGTRRLCQLRQTFGLNATPPAPPSAPSCDHVLVSRLPNSGPPVFAFRDRNGECLAGCTAVVPQADLPRIERAVLTVRRNVTGANPIEVTTTVHLRNS